jgi:hypothetical protein
MRVGQWVIPVDTLIPQGTGIPFQVSDILFELPFFNLNPLSEILLYVVVRNYGTINKVPFSRWVTR